MNFKSKLKLGVQKVGRGLSGMIMPNIGAFIAWGLITAFFIETGWTPVEGIASLVDPMLTYLLPLLVAYTAGKMVAGSRGAVIACVASIGVIVGSDIPMFLGVMIFAPLSALLIKMFDKSLEGKIKPGFEMLVNNFSIGIIGMGLAILGFYFIGPFITIITNGLMVGANAMYDWGLLPLLSVFVEPAKILFLNNAINHGILSPIGIQQFAETGKSIMYLIESNPGPGLGILLAYSIFGKGSTRNSAQGSTIIHFFGGIHEIYFPFVLMNPALILAVIAGGASGVFVFQLFDVGLVAAASPGSIISLLALCYKTDILFMLLGVAVSCVVSFLIASIFVKRQASKGGDDDLEKAKQSVSDMKSQSKGTAQTTQNQSEPQAGQSDKPKTLDKKIVFACDAGMGSSAMGATVLKKKFKQFGIDADIKHYAISEIPLDAEIVVTQNTLVDRAKSRVPDAEIYAVNNFMARDGYDALLERFTSEE